MERFILICASRLIFPYLGYKLCLKDTPLAFTLNTDLPLLVPPVCYCLHLDASLETPP